MRYTQLSAVTPALNYNVSTYLCGCALSGCALFCSCKAAIFAQCHSRLLSPLTAVLRIFWSVTRALVSVSDNHSAILSRSIFGRLDQPVQYSATSSCLSPQRMPCNHIGIVKNVRLNQGFRCFPIVFCANPYVLPISPAAMLSALTPAKHIFHSFQKIYPPFYAEQYSVVRLRTSERLNILFVLM